MIEKPTHAQLCQFAIDWLTTRAGCHFAIKELSTYAGEIPDAIGWKGEISIVIECKTSRSDYLADRSKWCRQNPARAMGDHRFFLSTPDVIPDYEAMPDGWGLLHWNGKKVKVIRAPMQTVHKNTAGKSIKALNFSINRNAKCQTKEISFLTSTVRRLANDDPYIETKLSVQAGWTKFIPEKAP